MEFIRGTTLVHLKIRIWGGDTKASRDRDIKVGTDGKMPPENLLDLGRKKIYPPKALDPFKSQRKAAERACLAEGTRFMGGFSIPDDDLDNLVTKIEIIKDEFYSNLEKFLANFEQNKQSWIEDNFEFSHIIRDQVPDRETVEKAFEFSIKLYKLQPLEGFEPDETEVANQILHEVGLSCKEMSNRMLDRKRAISGKNLSEQLNPLIKKLDTLSFGNGRILTVLKEFQLMRNSIPDEMIDREHTTFGHVLTFLSMCADSHKLERIIEGEYSVNKLIAGIKRAENGSGVGQSQPQSAISTTNGAIKTKTTVSVGAYF